MTSTATPKASPFLQLPAELRNQVYTDVLALEEPVRLIRLRGTYFGKPSDAAPALLQVCRETRDEARSIYYANKTFHFARHYGWTDDMAMWLKALDAEDVSVIRHIVSPMDHILDGREALNYLNKVDKALQLTKRTLLHEAVEMAVSVESVYFDNKLDKKCCQKAPYCYIRHGGRAVHQLN